MPPLTFGDQDTIGVDIDTNQRTITVRQSWLNTYMDCPERARRYAARIDPDPPNDAAATGTATHAAIEAAINAVIAGKPMHTLDDMLQTWHAEFDTLCEFGEHGQQLRWVKRNYAQCVAYGEDMVGRFHADVYERLDPHATEVGFGPIPLGVSANGWSVSAQGSIDYVDRQMGLVDWKSASRAYQPWEKRRWAIQPSVYLAAWEAMDADHQGWTFCPEVFNYVVFPDTTKQSDRIQFIPVTRASAQVGWLVDQVGRIAAMIEALGFDTPWPTRDQHALCSPKWCPSWDGCRGQFLGDDPVDWGRPTPNPTLLDFPKVRAHAFGDGRLVGCA